jgi:abortive infection bacteriophage resistance protein
LYDIWISIPCTPLIQAQFAGLFFYSVVKYTKPPFSCEQHIELLQSRGLIIDNAERAKKYIANVGYFRLTGYMYHLQSNDGNHNFLKGATFNDIILHYQFDKKLRALLMDYLERIEVALRARLTDTFSNSHGFYWYTDSAHFENLDVFDQINQEIADHFEDPQERFLKSFKLRYTSELLPPSNMALEILSLGKLSRLYRALSNKTEKMSIAKDFGLPSNVLSSWFVYLTNVRNICAHHSRLWNRKITADRPIIPTRKDYKFNGELPEDFNTTVYGIVSLISRLLDKINTGNRFIEKLTNLVDEYPSIRTASMGFPSTWKESPAWLSTSELIIKNS